MRDTGMKHYRIAHDRMHITAASKLSARHASVVARCGVYMRRGMYAPRLETVLSFLRRHGPSMCKTCLRSYQKSLGLDQAIRMPISGHPATYAYTRAGTPIDLDVAQAFGRNSPTARRVLHRF